MPTGRERPIEKPVFVGLTGTIASGKSTVLAEFEKLGVPVLSSDAVVHEIYESQDVIGAVVGRLGAQVLDDSGQIDRDAIAEVVFDEPEARIWLEQLIWPRVGRRILEFKKTQSERQKPPRMIVVEVPLLFESGMDQAFDRTVAVTAGEDRRREFAASRGTGISEFEGREARHLSSEEKVARADYVLENNGSLADLRDEVENLIAQIEDLDLGFA